MMALIDGERYLFKSYVNGKYLNIATDGVPANKTNVNVWNLVSGDLGQVWRYFSFSYVGKSGHPLTCGKNESFALDHWRAAGALQHNADIYTIGTTASDLDDQLVGLLLASQYYRIKLQYQALYLTLSCDGVNVR